MDHELAMARMERANKRLWILCIILIIALVLSNIWWFVYESQYEYYEITQDATDGGYINYIGNDGDINNGASDD